MVKSLRLKRRRDIARQRGQFLAVLATIVLGVMMFAATYDAYRNLKASYNGTYDRLAFADVTVTRRDTPRAGRPSLQSTASPRWRTAARRTYRSGWGTRVLLGRIVSLTRRRQPA